MLNAINTKIPLATLAAPSPLLPQSPIKDTSRKKSLLRIQGGSHSRTSAGGAEEQKKQDEEFRQRVEKDKKRHDSPAANEHKPWTSYVS
jgi:hypothetical protein